MFKIVQASFLSEDVKHFVIEAPKIALKQQPGQFVIIRVDASGERIPLTIAGGDAARGTIELIVQGIGKTTKALNLLEAGDEIRDLVGPLGLASEIEQFGHAVVIGGGVGTAIAFPTAAALKQAGNKVTAIIGARTRELVILEQEMKAAVDVTHVCTDDGSYGFHGFVTQKLQEMIDAGEQIDYVLAIGPIPMMKFVAAITKKYEIKTMVSLNPIMVDGTGMCGGCRVTVSGETKFACVDGPEFDGHQVDYEELTMRNSTYTHEEKCSLDALIATLK
ncbi:sulfide/dihydroorotate dehydrogenase-like FAD/NAD-binding protein [bacterium]|nr:sulfide/dihydroorotate dehydrogenase-like FAD/NAD-binding protein [bacterium]